MIGLGLFSTAPSADGHGVTGLFLALAALVTVARLGGWVAMRVGQPAVLGELLAGILVGPSLLGIVTPGDPMLAMIAEFGVVILLFQIGLHTDLASLLKVGPAAASVGTIGVVLPFAAGYLVTTALGLPMLPSVVCAAALTATSIGISARILGDLGELETTEGKTVLGAAVLDDVVGLVILAIVATLAEGGVVTTASALKTGGVAVGFLVVALLAGRLVAPRLFATISRLQVSGATGALALAFALALAAAAGLAGSAIIIGAFAAGLILHETKQRHTIEESTTGLGHFFVPIFFASVGASVDVAAMMQPAALQLGGLLLLIGIVGKFVAGYAPFWLPVRHALIGAAMVPRGEVGLIFAQMGLATGALTSEHFGAVMLMVIGTTVVTPPWLAALSRRGGRGGSLTASPDFQPGLDDLVAGDRARREE
ncbi:MAG: cation:proton antiporter [Gemmatimonadales bacterium]|nr:cation:proton antiporter [Gemmatimonadales bacterium]